MVAKAKAIYRIDMLPAGHGDCLVVTYGTPGRVSRVIIDCGTRDTAARLRTKLSRLRPRVDRFDLFVLTHVDEDHIGGSIEFFKYGAAGLTFADLWFNGWQQLPRRFLNVEHGEIFTTLIEARNLPWNEWTEGKAIAVKGEKLPTTTLPGGMAITLLSPTHRKLELLARVWKEEIERHGFSSRRARRRHYRSLLAGRRPTLGNVRKLADTRSRADRSIANGSSIAFLAEYRGKRVLFSGDAHDAVLRDSIKKILRSSGEEKLKIDAFKLPHHGSRANVTIDLLALLDCRHYLISTSGKRFEHPDGEALARVVVHGGKKPTLHFNYRTKHNQFWAREAAMKRFNYRAKFPPKGRDGITLDL